MWKHLIFGALLMSRLGWCEDPKETALYRHLLNQATQLLAERKEAVARLVDPASLEIRRDRMQRQIVEAVGGLPERTPLNPRTVWTKDCGDYRIEGVLYESRPGFPVTANLYIPNQGEGPFPGVLAPCGHSGDAKASEIYQICWINLARRGFVVLSFDPIGQGERMSFLDAEGKVRFWGTTEHTMLGVESLLLGYSFAREIIWDGIRSLDYLLSRPEVDPTRIGCTGNSGGGTQTSYLMAVDRRITCAAPSCFLTSLERLFNTEGPQDAEQNFIGQVARGIDHADFVEACLPHPVLICCASDDFFDIDGAWETFREAKNFFGRYGVPERVDIVEAPDKHGFTAPRRTAVYHWMGRWLKGERDEEPEPPTEPLAPKELLCTETGQVLTSVEGARSLVQLYAEEAASLRSARQAGSAGSDLSGLQEKLTRSARIRMRENPSWEQEIPKQTEAGFVNYKFHTEIEPGWKLQVDTIQPAREDLAEPVVWLNDVLLKEPDPLLGSPKDLAGRGHPVFILTPRGLDREDRMQGNSLDQAFGDYRTSFLALHVDRPLLGQRVEEVLAVVGLVSQRFADKPVWVVANREAAPPAAFAAVLDERVGHLILRDGLVSWDSIFEKGESLDAISNLVPGILHIADIPDLVETILPRKVTLLSARGPQGEALERAGIESSYSKAMEKALQAGTNPLAIAPEEAIE